MSVPGNSSLIHLTHHRESVKIPSFIRKGITLTLILRNETHARRLIQLLISRECYLEAIYTVYYHVILLKFCYLHFHIPRLLDGCYLGYVSHRIYNMQGTFTSSCRIRMMLLH